MLGILWGGSETGHRGEDIFLRDEVGHCGIMGQEVVEGRRKERDGLFKNYRTGLDKILHPDREERVSAEGGREEGWVAQQLTREWTAAFVLNGLDRYF